MSDQKHGISWTDQTWNPIVGCSKVGAGCHHCWAERMAKLHYHADFPNGWDGHVKLFPERLEQPLHWRQPRKIAVGLMGDLFHDSVPDKFIDRVFAVMSLSPQHTFQVLTKRPERMRLYLGNVRLFCNLVEASNKTAMGESSSPLNPNLTTLAHVSGRFPKRLQTPLPNVWLGVSIEDQATADERIPLLLQTPAAVRFVSCEPLLGRINLCDLPVPGTDGFRFDALTDMDDEHFYNVHEKIDWVIVGGESGPGARPMHPDWVRSLLDQCLAANVFLHFKQWEEWAHLDWRHEMPMRGDAWVWSDGTFHIVDGHEMPADQRKACLMRRIGKKAAGHLLDGREWLQFPEGK